MVLNDPKYDNFWKKLADKNTEGTSSLPKSSSVPLSKKEEVFISFMETAISRINNTLARIYTLEGILVEKGLISNEELVNRVNDAKHLPQTNLGRSILKEMVGDISLKTSNATIKESDTSDALSRIEKMVNFEN